MKYLICLFLLFLTADNVGSNETATEEKSVPSDSVLIDKFSFDGVWKPKAAILDGIFLPPPSLKGITLTVKKNAYEVKVDGESEPDKGTFTVDKKATPMRMTIKSVSGPNKGKTIPAIFEIKNEGAMRVCYDLSGKDYPKDFKAPKGSQRYTVGYRRQKTDAKDPDGK